MVCPHCLWDLHGIGPPILGDYACYNCGLLLTVCNPDVLEVKPRKRKKLWTDKSAYLAEARGYARAKKELKPTTEPMLPWHGKLFTLSNLPTDYLTWWQEIVAVPGEPLTLLVAEELRKRENNRQW